jgi:dynein heavy chain
MQFVIDIVNKVLTDIVEAIDGLIIMTPEIVDALDALYDARVPHEWIYDPLGGEISWIIPVLGQWFGSLQDRCNQLTGWLKCGNTRPITFWMTGFFNPQGFLTSMRQEVTRQHEKDSWALDDVVDQTEILQQDIERLRDSPAEGVYVRGLFIEGARWTKADGGRLDELEGKLTYVNMPVVHVSAKQSSAKGKGGKDSYENYGMYLCPVYKYPRRTTKYLISQIHLRCEGSALTALHWKLRGVAVLCSVE